MRAWANSSLPVTSHVIDYPSTSFLSTSHSHEHLFSMLLDVDSTIDEQKLRRAATTGIPMHLRPTVWKMLLGVCAYGNDGLEDEQQRQRDYHNRHIQIDQAIERKIRTVLKRQRGVFCGDASSSSGRTSRQGSLSGESIDDHEDVVDDEDNIILLGKSNKGKVESFVRRSNMRLLDEEIVDKFTRVISTYLQVEADVSFHPDMVLLCAPFVEVMSTEADAYYCFTALMKNYSTLYTEHGLQEAVSQFITMFRVLHQDLYEHFESEEIRFDYWVGRWLRALLVKELPRKSLLRLWDSYFAALPNQGLHLHPFVCLVFIEHIKPELKEFEDEERIKALLSKLKAMDIDYVTAQALAIREQLREKDVL